jgi:SAM-dependent methyltransferase
VRKLRTPGAFALVRERLPDPRTSSRTLLFAGALPPRPVREELNRAIADAAPGAGATVLEAGCGGLAPEVPWPAGVHVVGIDSSEAQLDRNACIHDKLLGDITGHRFGRQFDVVRCWDVLEHLPRPDAALVNLADAARPGGLLVVKVPNLLSVKGLLTKLTPYRFHVWVYRRVYGYEDAGVDDQGPFVTYMRRSITERGLRAFAQRAGLSIVHVALYESEHQARLRARLGIGGLVGRALDRAVRVLTFGVLSVTDTELLVVMRK